MKITIFDKYHIFLENKMGALVGAIVLVAIVLVASIFLANFIWDVSTDVSAGDVDIKLISCKEMVSGSTETVVELSNYNDFRVLVEWSTVGGSGYTDIPAKTIVTDQYYAYGTTQCGAEIKSVTRG